MNSLTLIDDHSARRARLGFVLVPEPRVRRSLVHRAPRPIAPGVVVPIDKPMADYAPFNFMARPGWKCIIRLVSLRQGVAVDDILGPLRITNVVRARMLSMELIHRHCGFSMPQIGRCFHRDHTTVLHAIRTVRNGFPAKRWGNQYAQ